MNCVFPLVDFLCAFPWIGFFSLILNAANEMTSVTKCTFGMDSISIQMERVFATLHCFDFIFVCVFVTACLSNVFRFFAFLSELCTCQKARMACCNRHFCACLLCYYFCPLVSPCDSRLACSDFCLVDCLCLLFLPFVFSSIFVPAYSLFWFVV